MGAASRIKTSLTSKGQTTVPKEVRDILGVGTGGQIEWILDGKNIRVRAKTLNIADYAGFLGDPPNGRHVSIEEMDQEIGKAVADRFRRKTAR